MSEETKQANRANPWADSPEEQELAAELGSSSGFSSVVNLKMQEGKNVLRIVGYYHMYLDYWLNNVQRTVITGRDYERSCPIFNHPDRLKFMDEGQKLRDAGKEEQAKAIFKKGYAFKPKMKYVVNVVDRADGIMKIWKFSSSMKKEIENIQIEHGNLHDYDLVVTRKGVKLKTKYSVIPARDSDPLTEDEKKQRTHNLSKLFQPTAIEKVKAYLRGEIPKKAARKGTTTTPETVTDQQVSVDDVEIPSPEELGDIGNFE